MVHDPWQLIKLSNLGALFSLMIGNHPFRWSNGQFSSLSLSAVHHPIPLHHRRGYLAGDAVQQRLKDERRFTLVSPHLMKPSLVPTNSSSFRTRTVNLQDRRFEPDWTVSRNYEIIQFNLATFSSDSPHLFWPNLWGGQAKLACLTVPTPLSFLHSPSPGIQFPFKILFQEDKTVPVHL